MFLYLRKYKSLNLSYMFLIYVPDKFGVNIILMAEFWIPFCPYQKIRYIFIFPNTLWLFFLEAKYSEKQLLSEAKALLLFNIIVIIYIEFFSRVGSWPIFIILPFKVSLLIEKVRAFHWPIWTIFKNSYKISIFYWK